MERNHAGRAVTDVQDYCRQVESYLCRKNGGHLIRLVGPAFDLVCGWASRGIPFSVVCRGIDRYCDRTQARGVSRRPARIEFCEHDVRDVFDEWRRATGVGLWDVGEAAAGRPRRRSLPEHLERLVARLGALVVERGVAAGSVQGILAQIESLRPGAEALRGAARDAVIERLRQLDEELIVHVRSTLDAALLRECEQEADAELAAYKDRMPADAYSRARTACIDRLVRDRQRLPTLALE